MMRKHDGQKAGVPERHAFAEAHGKAAVDAGEHDEDAGQDHEDPVDARPPTVMAASGHNMPWQQGGMSWIRAETTKKAG